MEVSGWSGGALESGKRIRRSVPARPRRRADRGAGGRSRADGPRRRCGNGGHGQALGRHADALSRARRFCRAPGPDLFGRATHPYLALPDVDVHEPAVRSHNRGGDATIRRAGLRTTLGAYEYSDIRCVRKGASRTFRSRPARRDQRTGRVALARRRRALSASGARTTPARDLPTARTSCAAIWSPSSVSRARAGSYARPWRSATAAVTNRA